MFSKAEIFLLTIFYLIPLLTYNTCITHVDTQCIFYSEHLYFPMLNEKWAIKRVSVSDLQHALFSLFLSRKWYHKSKTEINQDSWSRKLQSYSWWRHDTRKTDDDDHRLDMFSKKEHFLYVVCLQGVHIHTNAMFSKFEIVYHIHTYICTYTRFIVRISLYDDVKYE